MVTFVYGAYGTGNLGDDLLLKSALQHHSDEECRVVAFAKPLLRDDIPYIPNGEFIQEPGKFLARGDVIVFAGGGLFWSDEHIRTMLSIAEVASSVGSGVEVERIGVQGVNLDAEAARRFFSLASWITVRDANSVNLLRRLDITHRAAFEQDFVLAMDYLPTRNRPIRPRVGINHSAIPFVHDEKHRLKALKIYGELSRELVNVDFVHVPHTLHFTQSDQNDLFVGEQFQEYSNGRILPLPFPKFAEDLVDIYSGLTAAVGWRYHLNVLSTFVGIPSAVVCQDDEHKYRAYATENKIPLFDFDNEIEQLLPKLIDFISRSLRGEDENLPQTSP
jgi:polysaccharide pyruvyl transferase WcaK-like protein